MTRKPNLLPLHPGEILREEFLKPMGLSINGLARDLHVPPSHISGIVNEKRGISAVMALRLARYFGTTPALWLNLQAAHDLRVAEKEHGADIAAEVDAREEAAV